MNTDPNGAGRDRPAVGPADEAATAPELGATSAPTADAASTSSSPGQAEQLPGVGAGEPEPPEGAPGAGAKAPTRTVKKTASASKPANLRELIERVYRDPAGRPVRMSRTGLSALVVTSGADALSPQWLSDLARKDPLLRVPPRLLAWAATLKPSDPVQQALIELTHRVLAIHPIYRHYVANPTGTDPDQPPFASSAKVADAAKKVTSESLDVDPSAYRDAQRGLLRDNAVISFALLWVLRGQWTSAQFIAEMTDAVWSRPTTEAVSNADIAVALVTAGERQALNHLVGHFLRELRKLSAQLNQAGNETSAERQRAQRSESENLALREAIASERSHSESLAEQVTALTAEIEAERKSRFVDTSHMVDDYEILRTQVIRRLGSQVELLGDGLHALRSGSTPVAEEFVDRALTAIQQEIGRLKELGGAR
ncbi:hypothetical protein NIE79_004684 [Micromonospora sp. NIE79]|uniref:Uncharacterized protein n=1 Tax=Micromonospora trifolii TaxID=2911208 RepID=A0ABS9N828_9ACTN|nr:hypothetical protein [Micromonospora trifolii]MCG5446119.1 hypothetical protein [Micromonospora trifolii]